MHRLRLAALALIMVVLSTAVSTSFANAQENSPLVVSSGDWQDAFNAGESGAFVNPDTMSGPSTTLDGTADGPPEDSVYLVGLLTGRHLARCSGEIYAALDPGRFTGEFDYLVPNYPYVGLLVQPQADDTFKVLDVRAFARSGYCGRTPPRQPVETGEMGIGEKDSPIPFRMWGCMRPALGRRTIPLHVWPQTELISLFEDHLDWETTLQGKVSMLKVNMRNGYGEVKRETMHELERAIFVDELGCGKRHTAFLPAVYCDWRCQKLHFPVALSGQDPRKSWPSGRSSVYLPVVSTWRSDGVAATPFITTSLRLQKADETDSDTEPNGLAQGADWLCSLRSTVLVTDDGGNPDTITDTKKLELLEPVSMGDRLSQLTPTEHFRLTWPWVSPGRIGGKACEGVIVSNSNQRHAVLIITRDGYYEFVVGGDFRALPNGAVLFEQQVGKIVTFYIALEGAVAWPNLFDESVFGFAKFEMDVSDPELATVRQIGFFPTWSPVYEVAETSFGGRKLLQLVEEDGLVRSVDPSNMQEVATTRFPHVQRNAASEPRFALHRGNWHHRTNSIEEGGRFMLIGSGKKSGVVVVDLVDHTSWILKTPEAQKILGVAIKHTSGGTRGLLAVHGGDRVFVLQPNSDWRSAGLVSQFIFPKSSIQPMSYLSGPQGSVGWLWGDEFVVSWGQEDPRSGRNHRYEFARIKLHVDNVLTLDWMYDIDWNWKEAWPNDIWQCEGECAGPPPATSTPVPTDKPKPSVTPTVPPTVTPTPTVGPCVPVSKPADIMLVADGSTSMEGERSKQLALAVETFTSMVAQPNRIGLATFAGAAAIRQPLTNDRDAVVRALRSTILSAGTRIDLGLLKAREELNGPNHRSDYAKVIVLITDGEHNGTPEDTVLEQAALAKKEGAIIFTIALGTTQRGQDLLKLVATTPDRHFFFSPSPAELVTIYQEIARAIPCPTPTPTP